MSGVIEDTLAAHRPLMYGLNSDAGIRCFDPETWTFCGWETATNDANHASQAHAAHQARVLTAAGVGDLRGLLDDLSVLADLYDSMPGHQPRAALLIGELRTLARRYAPSDPTPKEPA